MCNFHLSVGCSFILWGQWFQNLNMTFKVINLVVWYFSRNQNQLSWVPQRFFFFYKPNSAFFFKREWYFKHHHHCHPDHWESVCEGLQDSFWMCWRWVIQIKLYYFNSQGKRFVSGSTVGPHITSFHYMGIYQWIKGIVRRFDPRRQDSRMQWGCWTMYVLAPLFCFNFLYQSCEWNSSLPLSVS